MVSEIATNRLKALISYLTFLKRKHENIEGYAGFEKDLVAAIVEIKTRSALTSAPEDERETCIVPGHIFQPTLLDVERFVPFTPRSESVVVPTPTAKASTKRVRDETDDPNGEDRK